MKHTETIPIGKMENATAYITYQNKNFNNKIFKNYLKAGENKEWPYMTHAKYKQTAQHMNDFSAVRKMNHSNSTIIWKV